MNLRPRFLLIALLLIVVSGMAAWVASRHLAISIIEQWAVRYVEKQVLYDKLRTLQPLLREIALSRQLAGSQVLVEWAHTPSDPKLRARAITEMESYRPNFTDKSYFVALTKSGEYFHNNVKNDYAGRQMRYVLDPDKASDKWFYDLVKQQRDIHINVNPDVELGVTKLWVDVLIRDGNQILGVAGTGLELDMFLKQVVDGAESGITSLFVDHDGAIQLYRDTKMIDFSSITKASAEHKTISLLFERAGDRDAIRGAMKEAEAPGVSVASRFVESGGKRYLAGVAYLPELSWFELTLLDIDQLLSAQSFSGILLVPAVSLLLALLLFNFLLVSFVLKPLVQLEGAMQRVRAGDFSAQLPTVRRGEIGRLIQYFADMRDAVRDARLDLEGKVAARTEELDRLSKTDTLTGLLNRRGMMERIQMEISRSSRQPVHFGVLWLDVDLFKEINDAYGHAVGDVALMTVAELIDSIIRPYDSAARWGGDEFLVLVQDCDRAVLTSLGERIRTAVEQCATVVNDTGQPVKLGVSIGAHMAMRGEDLDFILQRADEALYAAKADGRNCLRMTTPVRNSP